MTGTGTQTTGVTTIALLVLRTGELTTYFFLFISYLVPRYIKGRFCYLRGFYLEINEHHARPPPHKKPKQKEKNKKKKKTTTNNASEADTLISDGPTHFSDLVAEGPSVKSENLRFC